MMFFVVRLSFVVLLVIVLSSCSWIFNGVFIFSWVLVIFICGFFIFIFKGMVWGFTFVFR